MIAGVPLKTTVFINSLSKNIFLTSLFFLYLMSTLYTGISGMSILFFLNFLRIFFIKKSHLPCLRPALRATPCSFLWFKYTTCNIICQAFLQVFIFSSLLAKEEALRLFLFHQLFHCDSRKLHYIFKCSVSHCHFHFVCHFVDLSFFYLMSTLYSLLVYLSRVFIFFLLCVLRNLPQLLRR